MAFRLPPPPAFDFKHPEGWSRWIENFEAFRLATELSASAGDIQVNTLTFVMGPQAIDIMKMWNLSAEDKKKYDVVKKRFDDHFVAKRNIIFERAQFNSRSQKEGEPVEDYITALYVLAEHCNYGTLKEELIRDRLVVGLRDARLSEKLQLNPELTLERAVTEVRQSENVKKQQNTLRPVNSAAAEVAVVKRGQKVKKRFNSEHPHGRTITEGDRRKEMCSRCGRDKHRLQESCPATGEKCRKCKKLGHFYKMCRTNIRQNPTTVRTVELQENDTEGEDAYWLEELSTATMTAKSSKWVIDLKVGGRKISFKMDTGAEVTCMPEELYSTQFGPLRPVDKPLMAAGGIPMKVCGRFTEVISTSEGDHSVKCDIYVVKQLRQALLGEKAIEALELIKHIRRVENKECAGTLSMEKLKQDYPKVWQGLGLLPGECKIRLKEGAQPYAVSVARRVSIPLQSKVKAALQKMRKDGVIVPVTEPTEWCAAMVPVMKPNGQVRICVDYSFLNNNVLRERHIMPSVEQIIAQIGPAKFFTKLDANSGYFQMKLDQESMLLTTFLTQMGRFAFNRLPLGITSAPEIFTLKIQSELQDLPGVLVMMDDLLVCGETLEQHDQRLKSVMERLQKIGLTLNADKCQVAMNQVRFLGQVIDASGIKMDPDKVQAIRDFPIPRDRSELRSFMGMINQVAKFIPELSEKAHPINELLSTKVEFRWGQKHQEAFQVLKSELQSERVLAHYDTDLETVVSADASSFGLGAVLLQKKNDQVHPVAFASRSLTVAERHGYSQIEKEALALTWACEKFSQYLIGKSFHMETDHKPLLPLLTTKPVDQLPPRVQKFRMRLMKFQYTVSHVPGKKLIIADTLSRAPLRHEEEAEGKAKEDTLHVQTIIQNLSVSEGKLDEIRQMTLSDETCSKLTTFCMDGWPDKGKLDRETRKFWPDRNEITFHDGLLLKGPRLIIPKLMRQEVLNKLHESHQGITKCRRLAQQTVWWPGLSARIEEIIMSCEKCAIHRQDHAEPLISTEFPDRPWQKVGADLMELDGEVYLVLVDYFSRYVELAKLKSSTASEVIYHVEQIFSRHGIPEIVYSDNGPCFAAEAFAIFSDQYGFTHITSSPRFPQSNGQAENAVQKVKMMLGKCTNPNMALLMYRSTPLRNGFSPSELLMGRKLRTKIPVNPVALDPKWPYLENVKVKERMYRDQQERQYNKRHNARSLHGLDPGDRVWVKDMQKEAVVLRASDVDSTRSYLIQTDTGVIRRNRRHLVFLRKGTFMQEDNSLLRGTGTEDKTNITNSQEATKPATTSPVEQQGPPLNVQQDLNQQGSATQQLPSPIPIRRSNRVRKKPRRLDL